MFPKQQAPQKSKSAILIPAGIGAAVVLVAVVLAYCYVALPRPDAGKYQAVFLSNGQVYFGKLSGINSRSPVLDDVFYLQVNQNPQQAQGAEGTPVNASGTPAVVAEAQPKFSLMKLGQSEIHGPEDRLFLMKQQILFWENLRDDSQVVKTIQDSHAQAAK